MSDNLQISRLHASFLGREARKGWLLASPALALLIVASVAPLILAIALSLFSKHALVPHMKFIGLDNYIYLLGKPVFWNSLKVGVIYTSLTLGLQIVFGVSIALLLNQNFVGRNLARGLILFPYMLPGIVVVVIWRWMMNDVYGVIQYLMIDVFQLMETPITYSGNPYSAMAMVVMVSVWRFFPFVTLCTLARLQAIPEEIYDAAKVDGANAWQRFWQITLPQLKGILFVVVLLRGIWMFNEFDTVWLLTRGEPNHSTETVPLYAYITSFIDLQIGRGAAVSVLTLLVLLVVYVFYMRAYKLEED